MGPKKGQEMSKKTETKLKNKIIEDKTFGLKNKNKSTTVQKFIKGVEIQVTNKKGGNEAHLSAQFINQTEKKKQKQEEAFLNSLINTVSNIKQEEPEDGQETTTVLCAYFKAGACKKGNKCKYSHDLNVEFNQGAFDIYTDIRDVKGVRDGNEKSNNPENEINQIAEEKEKKRKKLCQSNIVCRFFLEAVQRKIYGWKWECPNGEDCQYKHCLPKGYILMTQADKLQEEMTIEEYMDLEEQIDEERNRIAINGTPVNETTFKEWKRKRDEIRMKERGITKEEMDKNKKKTGIQLFKFNADIFQDDAEAKDDMVYTTRTEEIEEEKKNDNIDEEFKRVKINEDLFLDENLDDILDDDEEEEEAGKKNDENEEQMDN